MILSLKQKQNQKKVTVLHMLYGNVFVIATIVLLFNSTTNSCYANPNTY